MHAYHEMKVSMMGTMETQENAQGAISNWAEPMRPTVVDL